VRDYEVDFGVTTSVQGRGGILLLDEVSSSVDQDTDRAIQTVIKEEFESYTIIMVSHRLEIVMDFDTVVVMEKGTVVESGNPRTLVDTNESRFKELWLAGNNA
jgi:ABC-type multidrug transport system fused ATPase/permease subunit